MDLLFSVAVSQLQDSPKSTPVGPVAGGIMGCFLILALGVYCYRHHVHRRSHQYITSLPDGQMPHMGNEIEDMDSPEDPDNGRDCRKFGEAGFHVGLILR